jgi:hypothetical protein
MTWQIDADNISPNSINTGRLSDFLVINEPIREFLDVDTSNRKLFVVGPKGLGKTLLLKVKSQRYRDEQSGFTFIPETELVSKFTNLGVSFSQRELAAFGTLEIWTKLWELALLTAILRRAGAPLPPPILAVLHNASSLPNILGALLSERGKLPRLYNYVHTYLGPAVRDLRSSHGITQLAFFIDNVDEALQDHTGLHLRAPQAYGSTRS